MKKILLILSIFLLVGCEAKPLATISEEDYTYNLTNKFDINDVVSNVSEGTDVAYTIDEDNNKLIITLTNGDKTETIEKDITIEKPAIEVSDGITYDTYTKETNVDDHITKPDTTTYDYTIDEDNSTITINFTDGEYKETVDKTIELTNSDPRPEYPWVYSCHSYVDGSNERVTIYENGSIDYSGYSAYLSNGSLVFVDGYVPFDMSYSQDYTSLTLTHEVYSRDGRQDILYCTLQ